jgi:glycosyltransferase A (GT-A) superfamily protein (DUF2064 family)
MLRCTAERLASAWPLVLAVTPDGCGTEVAQQLEMGSVATVDQGPGDLGERLGRVWRLADTDAPVAFFGSDSPDVPDDVLRRGIPSALADCELAVGPTEDGGYWTLAARSYYPQVLQGIDWGGPHVYDQTCRRAAEAGLSLHTLPVWPDVDRFNDVTALRRRLAMLEPAGDDSPSSSALQRLARRIENLCGDPKPAKRPP